MMLWQQKCPARRAKICKSEWRRNAPPASVVLRVLDQVEPVRHGESLRVHGVVVGDLHQVEAVEAGGAATGANAGSDGNGILGVVTLAAGIEGLVVIKGPATDHALGHSVRQQDLLTIGKADTTGSDDVAVLGPRRDHSSGAE
jgi:hypothetical protein